MNFEIAQRRSRHADDPDGPGQNGKIGTGAPPDRRTGGFQPADPAGAGARLPPGGGGSVPCLRRHCQPPCGGPQPPPPVRPGADHHRRRRSGDIGCRRQAVDPAEGPGRGGPLAEGVSPSLSEGVVFTAAAGPLRRAALLRRVPRAAGEPGTGNPGRHPGQAAGPEPAVRRL